jgi:predicted TIM-barrel fold metal-dependent hydrolase
MAHCRTTGLATTMLTAGTLLLIGHVARAQQPTRPPIIDVHLHAYSASNWKGRPPNPVTGAPGPASADEHMRQTLAIMTKYNIVKAIVSGPIDVVEQWRLVEPNKVLASPNFGRPDVDYYGGALPSIDALHALFKSGRLSAIGEIQAQYEGLSPSDPSLDPYFTLAESLDIPVGVHTGSSFPRTPYQGYPRFRVALGHPLLLEDALVRHPKLRVFIAHGGGSWTREAIGLMQMYPQVYMDVGVIWLLASFDAKAVDAWLAELIAGGVGDRIMFGTDQMRWPEAIGMAIDAIHSSKTLTEPQKRDILYNNAARFLRLPKQ